MRAQREEGDTLSFLFFSSFLPFFFYSTYSNYLQFRSDGRIARNTFWWKIIITVAFIQKWFASMHSTTTSCCCCCFSCICIGCTMLCLIMRWWWCCIMMRTESTTWGCWTIHIETKIDKKFIYGFCFVNHFIKKNDLLISHPNHSTAFWAFFSNVNKIVDVLLPGDKNTCI